MPHFAHQGNGLQPAEAFFDPLARALADCISAGIDAAKVFTVQELEEFERRYRAKAEEERLARAQAKLLPAPGEK